MKTFYSSFVTQFMTPERYQQIDRLLEAALGRAANARLSSTRRARGTENSAGKWKPCWRRTNGQGALSKPRL